MRRALFLVATMAPAVASADYVGLVETDSLHPYVESRSLLQGASSRDASCSNLYDDLMETTGDELVELVRHADIDCISDLQWMGDRPLLQIAVSREENVIAVGNGIQRTMQDYDGSSRGGIKTLFNFLRMVKDIHYWCMIRRKSCSAEHWTSVPTYSMERGSAAYAAVKGAIDSFVDHALFLHRGEEHADNLWEVAVTVNDYDMQEVYLRAVRQWLDEWDDDYASRSIFQDAMHKLLDIVYQGHRRKEDFGPVFGTDLPLLHSFRNFALDERWLDTSSHWIMDRCAIELGRYPLYRNTPNYDHVVPVIKTVLATHRDNPDARSVWLRLIAEIDYNESDQCERYGLCDWYGGDGFNANFRDALFVERLNCMTSACPADTVSLHAQALGQSKLHLACRRLQSHAAFFHDLFETDCEPVPEDVNSQLEIFVFNDGRSCEDLESAAFGRNPDSCSGIYWEGDPSDPETVARFVATEYTPEESPRDPDLAIWNFEHEYAHYLDGRYNRYGPYRGHDPSIHWWTEGLAEYFAAEVSPYIEVPAFRSPHSLSDTLLYSGRIPTRYAYRHLAVRYFMENRRDFIDSLLSYMRAGEFSQYTAHMAAEAPQYETEWQSWLGSGGALQALNRVRKVSVTPDLGKLTVSWKRVFGATGYRINWTPSLQRHLEGGTRAVTDGKTTSVSIPDLVAGRSYVVSVTATKAGLGDGPASYPAQITIPIPDTAELSSSGGSIRIDLTSVFRASGGAFAYEAVSSDRSLASATVAGSVLTIAANDDGDGGLLIVGVTATLPDGSTKRWEFVVTIMPSAERSWLRGWRRALLEQLRDGSD